MPRQRGKTRERRAMKGSSKHGHGLTSEQRRLLTQGARSLEEEVDPNEMFLSDLVLRGDARCLVESAWQDWADDGLTLWISEAAKRGLVTRAGGGVCITADGRRWFAGHGRGVVRFGTDVSD